MRAARYGEGDRRGEVPTTALPVARVIDVKPKGGKDAECARDDVDIRQGSTSKKINKNWHRAVRFVVTRTLELSLRKHYPQAKVT